MRRGIVVALALGAVALIGASAAGARTLRQAGFTPCGTRIVQFCGTVTVPIDPAPSDTSPRIPGQLNLAVRIVPHRSAPVGRTIFFVAGGPGESAISVLPTVVAHLGRAYQQFDLVFVDQRGTGRSGRLRCRDTRTRRGINRCGARLGRHRRLYTTKDTVYDLDAVRAALGAQQIVLQGTSYGGKVINDYAHRFPEHTEAVIFDSPTSRAGTDPYGRPRAFALPHVLNGLCAFGGCRRNIRGAYRHLGSTLRRLGARGRRATSYDGRGRARRVRVTRSGVYALVATSDEDPGLRGELPAAFAAGAHGDFAPLARLLRPFVSQGNGGISEPLFLATTCAEAPLPWNPLSTRAQKLAALDSSLRTVPRSAFAPFSAAVTLNGNGVIGPCLAWPSVEPPVSPVTVGEPLRSTRALVLSGSDDLRTTSDTARGIANEYAASFVAVPTVGHSVLLNDTTGCAVRALVQFLYQGRAVVCRGPIHRAFGLLPLAARTLGRTPGRRGLPRRIGRTLNAALATVVDVRVHAIALTSGHLPRRTLRYGGLRGGRIAWHRRTLRLTNVQVVRGVRVSGILTFAPSGLAGRIHPNGRGVAHGTLRLRHGVLSGRLGGRRVGGRLARVAQAHITAVAGPAGPR